MPYWKKCENVISMLSKQIIILIGSIFIAATASGQSINIEQASSELVADEYRLSAELDFDFDKELLDALEHGVAINIDIIINIKRERNWLWDPKIKEDILRFRLEHHPLSKDYLVTNMLSENRQQVQSLSEALHILGTIDNYFLISQDVLKENQNYICSIRAELNTETLPPAIRPVAFVSKKWQLESPSYEWKLKTP